ncbi:hypothetical protein E5K02_09995 [Hymenobacter metallicola]|uniref:Uncharacterized protein n=1 Tax=Hymenobacter metallicola TaxID=2563114 RepID=A0A4Z0QI72_9BACT|nr:hypothetical protein E5K02_09995 [Hymenobacter metallicola]
MKESRWRLLFRPKIMDLLAEIPAGTPEQEVRRLMRGKGPTQTSHLPKMWSKELNAQLDARFDRTRFTNLGRPIARPNPNQQSLF